jgi:hypothetical protein
MAHFDMTTARMRIHGGVWLARRQPRATGTVAPPKPQDRHHDVIGGSVKTRLFNDKREISPCLIDLSPYKFGNLIGWKSQT